MEYFAPTLLMIFNLLLEAAMVIAIAYLIKRGNNYKAHRNRLLREKEVMLDYVHDVGEAFADAENIDLDSFLERVLFYSMRTTKASSGAIYMNSEAEDLRCHAVAGVFPPLAGDFAALLEQARSKSDYLKESVRSTPVRKGEGVIGEAADFGISILIADAERDARIPHYDEEYLRIRSVLLVPMRFRSTVLGVLAVVNRTDGNPFSRENQNLLEGLAAQASASAHFISLRETIEAQKRMEHDLNVARNIQMSLLPKNIPQVAGYNIAAFNRPALAIGGDYYDVIEVDESHIGLAIADVSGKGIPGAILMSSCRSVLRAQAKNNLDPAAVLREINRAMSSDIAHEMFISMLYMILNTDTGNLSICRAGHEPPLVWRAEKGEIETPASSGMAIGLADGELFDSNLEQTELNLASGDCVVAYTDGISEAMDPEQNEWGVEALRTVIRSSAHENANAILDNITRRVDGFTLESNQYDDMTMLVLKVN